MYHPGKVLKILHSDEADVKSADKSVTATCSMWDENICTFRVAEAIEKDLKEGDVVLVDYYPRDNLPVPKHIITKILHGKQAKEIWDVYEKQFAKMRGSQPKPHAQAEYR